MVGGANKQCNLHTKEGVKLGTIGEQQSWVWAAAVRPDSNYVVSRPTDNGDISFNLNPDLCCDYSLESSCCH